MLIQNGQVRVWSEAANQSTTTCRISCPPGSFSSGMYTWSRRSSGSIRPVHPASYSIQKLSASWGTSRGGTSRARRGNGANGGGGGGIGGGLSIGGGGGGDGYDQGGDDPGAADRAPPHDAVGAHRAAGRHGLHFVGGVGDDHGGVVAGHGEHGWVGELVGVQAHPGQPPIPVWVVCGPVMAVPAPTRTRLA